MSPGIHSKLRDLSITICIYNFPDYVNTALYLHSHYRAAHHTPSLALDSSVSVHMSLNCDTIIATSNASDNSAQLSNKATQCAQFYAYIGRIDNSCPYKDGAGENMYYAWNSAITPSADTAVKGAMKSWYKKPFSQFDFANPSFSGATATMTQVLWRSSSRIGIGVFQDVRSLKTYVVALYSPAGNIIGPGEFQRNVFAL